VGIEVKDLSVIAEAGSLGYLYRVADDDADQPHVVVAARDIDLTDVYAALLGPGAHEIFGVRLVASGDQPRS
jgi:hypothetical protein